MDANRYAALTGLLEQLRACDGTNISALAYAGTDALIAIGDWKWHQASNNLYDHKGVIGANGCYPRTRRPDAPLSANPALSCEAAIELAKRLVPGCAVAVVAYPAGTFSAGFGNPPLITAEERPTPALAVMIELAKRLLAWMEVPDAARTTA